MKIMLSIFILLLLTSLSARADLPGLRYDGHIRLYVYHVDEFITIKYLDEKGRWLDEAYQKLNHLLRSRGDDSETIMDRRLIELADHLQDHFQVDTIEVISAYRSPSFNKKLKQEGHNVANESLHTKGLAMDIHIDEITEEDVRDYLLKIDRGGVGYYGDRLMVHMDFGPVRKWHGGNYRDNTRIGLFNRKSPVKVITDKLFYTPDGKLNLSFQGIKKSSTLRIHKFHRGKWMECGEISGQRFQLSEIYNKLPDLSPYGKFRLQYKTSDDWQNSNEFYIKKQVNTLWSSPR